MRDGASQGDFRVRFRFALKWADAAMICTYFFPILLAIIFTGYACSAMHRAGRTDPRDLLPIALLGLTFPGWFTIIHVGSLTVLLNSTVKVDFAARADEFFSPFPMAVSTGIAGMLVAGVFHYVLRNTRLTGLLMGTALVSSLVCIAGEPGFFFASLLWNGMAMFAVGDWSRRERARLVSPHTCPGCGYDIAGLDVNQCPECGHRIYPGPKTVRPPAPDRTPPI